MSATKCFLAKISTPPVVIQRLTPKLFIGRGFASKNNVDDATRKGWSSAFAASKEEDKQRGKHDNVTSVENALRGGRNVGDVRAESVQQGMQQKNINGPEVNGPNTKTDETFISKSAPRPIIGLEDERGGFQRPADGGAFKKKASR